MCLCIPRNLALGLQWYFVSRNVAPQFRIVTLRHYEPLLMLWLLDSLLLLQKLLNLAF